MFAFVLSMFVALLLILCLFIHLIRSENKNTMSKKTKEKNCYLSPDLQHCQDDIEKEIKRLTIKIRLLIAVLIVLIGLGFVFG